MDGTNSLPNDLTQCHQLLLAAYKQSVQLEQKATTSQQQVAELGRVLDETAASYEELQQKHATTLDELAWYKRWAFGRRRERFTEDEGQGHLFDLDPPATNEEIRELQSSYRELVSIACRGHHGETPVETLRRQGHLDGDGEVRLRFGDGETP